MNTKLSFDAFVEEVKAQHDAAYVKGWNDGKKSVEVKVSPRITWISVNDRLPENDRSVLFYDTFMDCVSEGYYDTKRNVWIQYRWCAINRHVTYWAEKPRFTFDEPSATCNFDAHKTAVGMRLDAGIYD